MKRLYTYGAMPVQRHLTVADLRAGRGGATKFTQVTASNFEEAQAAAIAGIDTLVCDYADFTAVRAGAPHLFLTTNLPAPSFVTKDDILRAALEVAAAGSDAVYTCRSLETVEMLARESLPVMSHIGMNPRKSTWYGGLRVLG